MSSSAPVESKQELDHGSSTSTTTTTTHLVAKPKFGTLSIFTTGAQRSVHQCGTCQRPIQLSCERLKHVAHCKAIDDSGKACNVKYSTLYGCAKHPYRDGHNPKMREHSAIVKAGLGGSASSPALASMGRLVTFTKSPLSNPSNQANASSSEASASTSTTKPQKRSPSSTISSSVKIPAPAPSSSAEAASSKVSLVRTSAK